jgi:predicted DNA-binding antitoxin AbrB/MazE fold protein
MTKQIEAVYENGVLRPVEPVELTEGEHFRVIIVTRNAQQPASDGAAKALSEIAALPIEGA